MTLTFKELRMPHHHPLDWIDVADAPQLTTLKDLNALLELTITALVAAHPELESSAPIEIEHAPPSLWLAEVLVETAATLRVSLDRYEVAIRRQRHLTAHDGDVPW